MGNKSARVFVWYTNGSNLVCLKIRVSEASQKREHLSTSFNKTNDKTSDMFPDVVALVSVSPCERLFTCWESDIPSILLTVDVRWISIRCFGRD